MSAFIKFAGSFLDSVDETAATTIKKGTTEGISVQDLRSMVVPILGKASKIPERTTISRSISSDPLIGGSIENNLDDDALMAAISKEFPENSSSSHQLLASSSVPNLRMGDSQRSFEDHYISSLSEAEVIDSTNSPTQGGSLSQPKDITVESPKREDTSTQHEGISSKDTVPDETSGSRSSAFTETPSSSIPLPLSPSPVSQIPLSSSPEEGGGGGGVGSIYEVKREGKSEDFEQQLIRFDEEKRSLLSYIRKISSQKADLIQQFSKLQQLYDQTELENQKLLKNIRATDQQVRELESQKSHLQIQLSSREQSASQLQLRLHDTNQQLQLSQAESSKLRSDLRTLQQQQQSSDQQVDKLNQSLMENIRELKQQLQDQCESHISDSNRLRMEQEELQSQVQQLSLLSKTSEKSAEQMQKLLHSTQSQLKQLKEENSLLQQSLVNYKRQAAKVLESREKQISQLSDLLQSKDSDGSELSEHINLSVDGESPASALPSSLSLPSVTFIQSKKRSRTFGPPIESTELLTLREENQTLLTQLSENEEIVNGLSTSFKELEEQYGSEKSLLIDQINQLQKDLDSERLICRQIQADITSRNLDFNQIQKRLEDEISMVQQTIKQKNQEIETLSHKVNSKTMISSSEVHYEERMRHLTNVIVQKQSNIDALSLEISALKFKLENRAQQHPHIPQHEDSISLSPLDSSSSSAFDSTSPEDPLDQIETGIHRASRRLQVELDRSNSQGKHSFGRQRSTLTLIPSIAASDSSFSRIITRFSNSLDNSFFNLIQWFLLSPGIRLLLSIYFLVIHIWILMFFFSGNPPISDN